MNTVNLVALVIGAVRFDRAWQPPSRSFIEEMEGTVAQRPLLRRIADFVAAPENYDGDPMKPIVHIFNLDSDARLLAHPHDFLPNRSKSQHASLPGIVGE